MRDTDEVEAIVTQAARLPAVASACGTAPRFFPHTTTAAFAQMAEPPPQIVDSDAAQERHARLHLSPDERAVAYLQLAVEDAMKARALFTDQTRYRLDLQVVTDIYYHMMAILDSDDSDDAA